MDFNTKICLLVCAFAAAREFRPVEPFFTEFLVGPDIGFTEKQDAFRGHRSPFRGGVVTPKRALKKSNETKVAVQDIFVIWSYSSFVLIIIVFLITDFLRYKPIIIADGVAGIMTYVLLLGHPSVRTVQIEQVFYSFFYSSDTAYYTYMYAKIQDRSTYNKITGYVRASVLFGKFLSGCMSQIFVSFGGASKLPLVYMSVGGMSVATILSLLFPPVKTSLYFHRRAEDEQVKCQAVVPHSPSPPHIAVTEASAQPEPIKNEQFIAIPKSDDRPGLSTVVRYVWTDFKTSFTNREVVVWAFWWSVAGAGSNLVLSYCQVIWKEVIDENYEHMNSWNGVVDCIYTALSAAASYKVGTLDCDWSKHSNVFLMVGSICIGVLVMLTSQLKNLWLLYLCHILFGLAHHTMITVAEFPIDQYRRKHRKLLMLMKYVKNVPNIQQEFFYYWVFCIAKQVKETCYGLVFGFIAFLTILFTTIWTVIIVEDTFFTFNIKRQFEFCAVYFLAIGIYYLFRTLQQLFCGKRSKQ